MHGAQAASLVSVLLRLERAAEQRDALLMHKTSGRPHRPGNVWASPAICQIVWLLEHGSLGWERLDERDGNDAGLADDGVLVRVITGADRVLYG